MVKLSQIEDKRECALGCGSGSRQIKSGYHPYNAALQSYMTHTLIRPAGNQAEMESLVRYGMSTWCGTLIVQANTKFTRPALPWRWWVGRNTSPLSPHLNSLRGYWSTHHIYSTQNMSSCLAADETRVLHCKLHCFKNWFVPISIKLLNEAAWGWSSCAMVSLCSILWHV